MFDKNCLVLKQPDLTSMNSLRNIEESYLNKTLYFLSDIKEEYNNMRKDLYRTILENYSNDILVMEANNNFFDKMMSIGKRIIKYITDMFKKFSDWVSHKFFGSIKPLKNAYYVSEFEVDMKFDLDKPNYNMEKLRELPITGKDQNILPPTINVSSNMGRDELMQLSDELKKQKQELVEKHRGILIYGNPSPITKDQLNKTIEGECIGEGKLVVNTSNVEKIYNFVFSFEEHKEKLNGILKDVKALTKEVDIISNNLKCIVPENMDLANQMQKTLIEFFDALYENYSISIAKLLDLNTRAFKDYADCLYKAKRKVDIKRRGAV